MKKFIPYPQTTLIMLGIIFLCLGPIIVQSITTKSSAQTFLQPKLWMCQAVITTETSFIKKTYFRVKVVRATDYYMAKGIFEDHLRTAPELLGGHVDRGDSYFICPLEEKFYPR